MKKEDLKKKYEDACNEYLKLFCDKHEYEYRSLDTYWIGDNIGEICAIGDLFADMRDIKYDIDNDVDEKMFEEWYFYRLNLTEMGLNDVNYRTYCMGGRPYSEEQLNRLTELYNTIQEEKDKFNNLKDEYNKEGEE